MPLITLITDFGIKDFYVGSLKGNIYSACKDALLVDITHEIERHGLVQAAYVLKCCFPDFPEGSFHLMLIDTEKEEGKPILFKYNAHFFLGIDNGVFNIATDGAEPDWVVELEPEKLGFNSRSNLNNYFAAVLGALNNGKEPLELGTKRNKLLSINAARPAYGDWGIRGEVIYIDNYENVVLNIDRDFFETQCNGRPFHIEFKHLDRIEHICESYSDVEPGELLAFFNGSGHLEIAVNHGKAASLLGLKLKTTVQINFK